MRKFFLFFIMLFSCLEAMYIGNPSAPMQPPSGYFIAKPCLLSFKMGYLNYYLYKGRFKDKHPTPASYPADVKLNFQAATMTVTLKNKIDFYAYLGEADLEINQVEQQITTNNRWSFSAGGKIILLKWHKINAGLDLKYFLSKQYPQFILSKKELYQFIRNDEVPNMYTIKYKEWQPSLGFSYVNNFISPYIGFVFTYAKMTPYPLVAWVELPNGDGTYYIASEPWITRHFWGAFVGCSVFNKKALAINLETRMFDQNAAAFLLEFKF